MPRVVAIVGSRDWPVDQKSTIDDFVKSLPGGSTVVTGGAKGVDTWAEEAADKYQLKKLVIPVTAEEWNTLGRRAGYLRNVKIVNASTEVKAFWDEESTGTTHSTGIAREQGKPHDIVTPIIPTDPMMLTKSFFLTFPIHEQLLCYSFCMQGIMLSFKTKSDASRFKKSRYLRVPIEKVVGAVAKPLGGQDV